MAPSIYTSWKFPDRIAVVVFLIVLAITQVIAYKMSSAEKNKEQLLVQQEAVQVKTKLEESLSHSVTATRMLAYLMENDLVEEYFESISRELAAQNPFIDALQYVIGNVIVDTYPREGHEATIGFPMMDELVHRQQAMMALERGDLYFEGPFELRQGGAGVVGRYPVMRNEELYGFAAVVIRLETIHRAISLDQYGESERFIYQVKKETEADSLLFFQNTETFESGLVHTEFVPFGNWNVNVKLKDASYFWSGLLFSGLGLLFSGVLALFISYLVQEPKRLQVLVDERTDELKKSEIKLQDYNEKLVRSNKELEQFAYIISHDLQEPLRMITGFLAQLERKYEDQLDEKGKKYIFFATDGAKRMRQIILDLLDFSRIGRVDSQKEPADLNEIFEEVKQLNRQYLEEKGAKIESDPLPTLRVAKVPFRQLIHNLVNNGLKFQEPGNKPVVKIKAKELENDWQFSVSDNGIGIAEEYTEKIFNLFQRLHGKQEYSGSGIGLAICKKVVEEHGGRIWVESEPGQGSTFYFTIPKL